MILSALNAARGEGENAGMASGMRRKLGRPPLPPERRKRHVSCYLAPEIVDALDHLASERRTTRNQVATAILSEHVATVSVGARGDRAGVCGAGSATTDG